MLLGMSFAIYLNKTPYTWETVLSSLLSVCNIWHCLSVKFFFNLSLEAVWLPCCKLCIFKNVNGHNLNFWQAMATWINQIPSFLKTLPKYGLNLINRHPSYGATYLYPVPSDAVLQSGIFSWLHFTKSQIVKWNRRYYKFLKNLWWAYAFPAIFLQDQT